MWDGSSTVLCAPLSTELSELERLSFHGCLSSKVARHGVVVM